MRDNRLHLLGLLTNLRITIDSTGSIQALGEESHPVSDYSNDLRGYAQAVARLNSLGASDQSIKPAKGVSKAALYAVLCKTDGAELRFDGDAQYTLAGPRNCYTLFFSSPESAQKAAEVLNKMDSIVYAECDSTVKAASAAAVSFHSSGAERMRFGDYLPYTAQWGSGSAGVAVIDSGCYAHPLIKSKLRTGGFDYVDADFDTSNDGFGHGTGVAGVIADCTFQANVYIYPIRVLDSIGNGKMSNVVNAVREAIQSGCAVMNLSIESTIMSEALDDAILQAVSSGVAVVVSAGNDGGNTSGICPAHLTDQGVIVVGSAEGSGGDYTLASYSNYGASVDVYAFGTAISCCAVNGGYSTETGTSFAAPHVSACCALMHLIHPGLSPSQMEARLIHASTGQGTVRVPELSQMIPQTMGFHLTNLQLETNSTLDLPTGAYPVSSAEQIAYTVSDDQIVSVSNGKITGLSAGSATVTASCTGLEDAQFEVTVTDKAYAEMRLPDGLKHIEASAFEGDAAMCHAVLPFGVETIEACAFDQCASLSTIDLPATLLFIDENNSFSDAVLLCGMDSTAYSYALAHDLQYICKRSINHTFQQNQ